MMSQIGERVVILCDRLARGHGDRVSSCSSSWSLAQNASLSLLNAGIPGTDHGISLVAMEL